MPCETTHEVYRLMNQKCGNQKKIKKLTAKTREILGTRRHSNSRPLGTFHSVRTSSRIIFVCRFLATFEMFPLRVLIKDFLRPKRKKKVAKNNDIEGGACVGLSLKRKLREAFDQLS